MEGLPQSAMLHELHEQQRTALLHTGSHEEDDVRIPHLAQGGDLQHETGLRPWIGAVYHLDSDISNAPVETFVDLQGSGLPSVTTGKQASNSGDIHGHEDTMSAGGHP